MLKREEIARIKEMYPKGTPIRLYSMEGEQSVPPGSRGVVDHVDDIGQIHMKPMMHEEDCEVGDDKNIPSFGICQSEENPVNKSWFAKAGDKIKDFFTGEEDTDDAEKIILKTEDGQNVKGYPCTPCIVGTWKDVYESEKILRNNADATSEGDKLSALTQRSFLVCAYGGLIEPISSGQEE